MAVRRVREWRYKYLPRNVRVWVAVDYFGVQWVDKFNRVYAGTVVQFVSSDLQGQRQEVFSRLWEGPMKKKDLTKMKGALLHADPGELAKEFPQLAEFMTAAVYDGGKERREAPTVTLWAAGGQWKASVKDRAEGLVLWLSADTIHNLLVLLDSFVLEPTAPWRHDEFQHERNGKRVKKST